MSTLAVFAALTVAINIALVAGVMLLTRRRTRPAGPVRSDRVGWQVYLNDLPNPCGDGHTRLYLTGPAADASGVICSVCTTELERPAWMDCLRCYWFPIDGHLHVVHCETHRQPASTAQTDPQQEAA